MDEKIHQFKKAIASQGKPEEKVSIALDELGHALAGSPNYPAGQKLQAALVDSVAELESQEQQPGRVTAIWRKLTAEVQHWEMEHPRITKILGDIASALANSGI